MPAAPRLPARSLRTTSQDKKPIASLRLTRSCLQRLLPDGRLLDEIEPAKVLGQVGIAFHLHPALVGAAAARRAFAVFGVELVDHLNAGDDAAKWREALAVEAGVVAEVDEHLAGSGV